MSLSRFCIFATALLGGALAASAQAPALPPGLTQSGGTIMMEPIPDSDSSRAPDTGIQLDPERHPGQARALSASDHDLYSRAFDAADHGDWTAARALAGQGHDAIAQRLVLWRYLLDKNSGATFAEIDAFAKANPDWPLHDTILARAEQAMDPNMSPPAVLAWFGDRAPVSALGKIRLGDAMIATGKIQAGRDLVRQAWMDNSFDPDKELAIVQKDGGFFTPELDRQRLNELLWREDISSARRELSRVTDNAQSVAEARMALRTNPAAGQKMIARLPDELRNDPNLQFDQARTVRRGGDDDQAEALLLRVPARELAQHYPDKLWGELNITAREALKDHNYKTAYQLVSDTGLKSGTPFSEAEFMAGWIALRFLNNPQAALPHFQKLEAGVSRPISLARAHYWQGRAYEAEHDLANAWQQYRLASKAPTAFYGQIASARIDATPTIRLRDTPSEMAPRAEFEKEELTRAMRVLADLGQVSLLRTFALRSQELHPDAKHVKLLAQTLMELGFPEAAVRVAKTASYDGMQFFAYTHPVISIPPYRGPGSGPETALVLGLIRQETEFDPDSVSNAGARGIMQIMPGSARHTSAVAGVPYRPNDLLSDPDYNIRLGMAEFGGHMSDWSGSLILAAAAYNAGPTNVKKWLASNGDPREAATDPLDWIEQIPFTETRNYVMRVLENTQVYRARLAGREVPSRILADLYAPNAPGMTLLAYTPPPVAAPVVPAPKPAAVN